MEKQSDEQLLIQAVNAALKGGIEILKVYNGEISVTTKADDSPLTLADERANAAIEAVLKNTQIPILSEEGRSISYNERKDWKELWVVDPLDGTKEFIKRNGEFTVNIAFVRNGLPDFGVVYVPVKEMLYVGWKGHGVIKRNTKPSESFQSWNSLVNSAEQLPKSATGRPFRVVGSRSHMSAETEAYINDVRKEHPDLEMVSMGSSLKICLVAEGEADVYPRFAPTMEWDTAAGHALVRAAGKTLLDWNTKQEMRYNRENLTNNWFLVS